MRSSVAAEFGGRCLDSQRSSGACCWLWPELDLEIYVSIGLGFGGDVSGLEGGI